MKFDFTALTSHPVPAALTVSAHNMQIRHVLTSLEEALISSNQDKVLVLLEKELMEALALLSIERLLRYTPCQRILLLVPPNMKVKMGRAWMNTVSWEDGSKPAEHFSMTSMPKNDQQAQVCIATIIDIQRHVGINTKQPFFKTFDAVVVYDAPSSPGPVWIQIVDCFAASDIRVIGLSSQLSEEDGELLFGKVVDTKKASNHILKQV